MSQNLPSNLPPNDDNDGEELLIVCPKLTPTFTTTLIKDHSEYSQIASTWPQSLPCPSLTLPAHSQSQGSQQIGNSFLFAGSDPPYYGAQNQLTDPSYYGYSTQNQLSDSSFYGTLPSPPTTENQIGTLTSYPGYSSLPSEMSYGHTMQVEPVIFFF